jgi:hypothetical protein
VSKGKDVTPSIVWMELSHGKITGSKHMFVILFFIT